MNERVEMNIFAKMILLGGLLSFASLAFGHGNETHAVEYDPVENEFGSYESGMKASRIIKVDMSDQMRFTPDLITVKVGEVIRFEHTNSGQLMHEFVLGTQKILDEHAELMKQFPNMEHDEPYMAHVAPGKTGVIMWKFTKAGTFGFGCLIPGHYDAGMKGQVVVEM